MLAATIANAWAPIGPRTATRTDSPSLIHPHARARTHARTHARAHACLHWQVLVPCELGYGKRGSGALIKAGDALSFKIELQRVF